jgi:hypothetical protein
MTIVDQRCGSFAGMLTFNLVSTEGCSFAFAKATEPQSDFVLLWISNCRCTDSKAHNTHGMSG